MPKKYIVLDSSVLISAMAKNDGFHRDSVNVFNEVSNRQSTIQILLPPLAMYETIAVLRRKGVSVTTLQERISKLTMLDFVTTIGLTEFTIFKHAGTILSPNSQASALRTNDLLIASLAIEFEAAIVTFDEKLWRKLSQVHPNTFFCSSLANGIPNQITDFLNWM